MKPVLTTRRRLARVRATQLKLEMLDLAVARTQLCRLEEHQATIDRLATTSDPVIGSGLGVTLASAIELRQRLISASMSLAGRVGAERATVTMHQSRFVIADRNKQIADKLLDRSASAAQRAIERRAAMPTRRKLNGEGDR